MNDYTRILLRNVCDGDLSRVQYPAWAIAKQADV